MLSKNQIKFVRSLAQKKFRNQHGLFIAEGSKLVTELINHEAGVQTIFGTNTWLEAHAHLHNDVDEVIEVTPKELERISGLTSPQEVLCLTTIHRPVPDCAKWGGQLVLALDAVNDPGNLGTILRTADWFGIKQVVCSNNSVDLYNPKTVQATMGSIARVEVAYTDLHQFMQNWKAEDTTGPIYGMVLDGQNLFGLSIESHGLIVMGSESHGIDPKLLPLLDQQVTIPAFGAAESLNVAIATAIVCAEFKKATSQT